MNLKFKLTFWFTGIVAAILLVSFYFVYENYALFRQINFYQRLSERAQFISESLIDANLDNQSINRLNDYALNILPNFKVAIYASGGELIGTIGDTIALNTLYLTKLKTEKVIEETLIDTQIVAFKINHNNNNYLIISSGFDKTGFNKLDLLRNLFLFIWFVSVLTTSITGWFFAKLSLNPMNQVIQNVQTITANNLHSRLSIKNTKDEIATLSYTFNQMLDRLESSFLVQKDFVSNASHEFRTPLTAIKGQIQVALLKNRETKEYKTLLQSLNADVDGIIELLNALQELAKANADFPIKAFKKISIIDALIDAQSEFLKNNEFYHVEIQITDLDENTNVFGDSALLKSAFLNLIDNGCKFSADHKVVIWVYQKPKNLELIFKDEGVGIAKENISQIFEPFFRVNEIRNIYGHGLGLSLVKRIIELHKGSIDLNSELGKGSSFLVKLPLFDHSKGEV